MNIFKNLFRSSTNSNPKYLTGPRPRHELNVQGDFYVEKDSCTLCGAPEVEAMGLMAHSAGGCYFIRQPETEEEIEQAINAIAVSCVSAVRYGGTDQKIIKRLYALKLESECDYIMPI
ncbi:hypothetical protein GM921_07855 [Pedobacter sp. LMG 31464]|uniref:Ferredoxin n=1 Tax=Pedobacter planticolens TaxID=2679964 RepID=A0A923IV25_9SPHI|nr:ferredoxin [Pedobacter planticolens]MBB2145393.1 hypothetical protein [Pedobacter planticolens]